MPTEVGLARFDAHVSPNPNPNPLDRSASVLYDGILDGVSKRITEAKEHPLETAAALAGTALCAYALAKVCSVAGPKFTACAQIGLTVPLVGDLLNRGGHVAAATYDTYQNPSHYDANRKTIASYGGEGVFDYTAYGIAGMAGVEAAQFKLPFSERFSGSGTNRNRWNNMMAANADPEAIPIMTSRNGSPELALKNLPENSPLKNLFSQQKGSVVQIGKFDPKGETLRGSGFLVTEDGVVATNAHVVHGVGRGISIKTDDGSIFPARLLARDVEADLALLKIQTPPGDARTFKSVALADTSRGLGSREGLAVIGHPSSVAENVLTPVNYVGRTGWKVERIKSPFADAHPDHEVYTSLNRNLWESSHFTKQPSLDAAKPFVRTEKLFYEGSAIPGNSGGPIFDMNGKVVGVHSHGFEGQQKHGTAVEHLRTLMDVTLNREPQQGWLRVTSHLDEPPPIKPDVKMNATGSATTAGAVEVAVPSQPQAAAVAKIGRYDRTPLAERLALAAEQLAAGGARPSAPPTWLQLTQQHLLHGVTAGGVATYRFYLHELATKR